MQSAHTPIISIVMPTYNMPNAILGKAVNSILDQTIQDFEFIIVDDGSTKETREYLEGLTDPRIQVIRNEHNLGITKSLNIGFRKAQGTYIARMDSDDFSLPDRFEKQLAYMEAHPDIVVCGSKATHGKNDMKARGKESQDMETYRIKLLFSNPGPSHPTAFFRREELLRRNIEYDENLKYSQDYGMWMVISQFGKIGILPDILVYRQENEGRISFVHKEEQIQCDKMTQRVLLSRLVEDVTDKELDLHYRCMSGRYKDVKLTKELRKWCRKLVDANNHKSIYDRKKFKKIIYKYKRRILLQSIAPEMLPLIKKVKQRLTTPGFTQNAR